MDKQDNPYLNLLEIMQNQSRETPKSFIIGNVLSADPLSIKVAENIILDKEDMLINDFLLAKYNRKIKIKGTSVNGSVSPEGTLTSFDMAEGEVETLEDYLKAGDKVILLLSEDQQQFILLCKVR